MPDDFFGNSKFIDGILTQARYIARSPEKIDTHSTLSELLSYSHLTSLVLTYQHSVRDALRLLWGGYGFDMVKKILNTPHPGEADLDMLVLLIHDHVRSPLEIDPVLEAVSYALGNDTLFGEPFTDSRLRDAAEIPF